MQRQEERRPRLLVKLKSFARSPRIFAFSRTVGPRVGAAVGRRVEPRAVEEVVLDELEVGVEAQRLVVDVARASRTG